MGTIGAGSCQHVGWSQVGMFGHGRTGRYDGESTTPASFDLPDDLLHATTKGDETEG